jgi:hypothetical protein
VRIGIASEQGRGAVNEDRAGAGADWAFVVDGATAPSGLDSGCVHGVRWFADRLAAGLAAGLAAEERRPLPDVLAAAIASARRAHGPGCDLDHPDSPSATVAVVRAAPGADDADGAGGVEYLVLGDATVLLPTAPGPGGGVRAVTDDRLDHLPGGRPYSRELVRASRNAPGGFWVAGTSVAAAYEALHGTARTPGRRFAAMTDGCARLAELFGASWAEVWELLVRAGPEELVARVRAAERAHGVPRGKRHDDATVVVGAFDPPAGPPPGAAAPGGGGHGTGS